MQADLSGSDSREDFMTGILSRLFQERPWKSRGRRFQTGAGVVPQGPGLGQRPRASQRRAAAVSLAGGESLEPRLALAVSVAGYSAFSATTQSYGDSQTINVPGRAIIASSSASDIYVQRVASRPSDLLVADNASFLDYEVINSFHTDVPASSGASVVNPHGSIANYEDLFITNGTPKQETVEAAQWWLFGPRTTRLSRETAEDWSGNSLVLNTGEDVFGTISYVQADGTESVWTFTALGPTGISVANLQVSSGPGYGGSAISVANTAISPQQPLLPGQIYPLSIRDIGGAFEVEWSETPLRPPVIAATWHTDNPTTAPNIAFGDAGPFFATGTALRPDLAFTLRGALATAQTATESPSLGVIPGTLSGSLLIGGQVVSLRDAFLPGGYATLVNGSQSTSLAEINRGGGRQIWALSSEIVGGRLLASVSDVAVVTTAAGAVFGGGGTSSYSAPSPTKGYNIPPGGTVTAFVDYLVYTRDQQPMEAVFAPGLDIRQEVTVDLLTPGSTVSVNSPIIVDIDSAYDLDDAPDGDVDFRATNVFLNAPVRTPDYFMVGQSQVSAGQPRLLSNSDVIPAGHLSPAYDDGFDQTPTLQPSVYGPFNSASPVIATAKVGSDGSVIGLNVAAGNEGYGYQPGQDVEVTVAPPTAQRAELAVISQSGSVESLSITSSGEDYLFGATLSISQPEYFVVESLQQTFAGQYLLSDGSVPSVPPVVVIAPPTLKSDPARIGYGEAATANAELTTVVSSIAVTNGGTNYSPNTRVTISPPPVGNGLRINATAIPVIQDKTGVITGITITNPGAGYDTTLPITITISDPGDQTADNVTDKKGPGTDATAIVSSLREGVVVAQLDDFGRNYESISPQIEVRTFFDGQAAVVQDSVDPAIWRATFASGYEYADFVDVGMPISVMVDDGSGTLAPLKGVIAAVDPVDPATGEFGVAFSLAAPAGLSLGQEVPVLIFLHGDYEADYDYQAGTMRTIRDARYFATLGKDPARGSVQVSNGLVTGVSLTHGGSGYKAAPRVTVIPNAGLLGTNLVSPGSGALVSATVDYDVAEVGIIAAGTNYFNNEPGNEYPVRVAGGTQQAELRVTFDNGRVTGGTVVSPGSGYSGVTGSSTSIALPVPPALENAEEKTAKFRANISPDGSLRSFTRLFGGVGYSEVPVVTVQAPPVLRDASAVAVVDRVVGGIAGINVVQGGGGYVSPPRVVIDPPADPSGVQAVAQAILDPKTGRVREIEITNSGAGYLFPPRVVIAGHGDRTYVENFQVLADTSAGTYELYVGDEPGTLTPRGTLRVSPQASLSAQPITVAVTSVDATRADVVNVAKDLQIPAGSLVSGTGLTADASVVSYSATAGTLTLSNGAIIEGATPTSLTIETGAQELYLEATAADVLFEGVTAASQQTYLISSRADRRVLAPVTITTRSAATGQHAGRIQGDILTMTLGNDVVVPQVGGSGLHVVDLRTTINSVRLTAAESEVDPRGVFPYAITLDEKNALNVDGVIASSGPFSLAAGGDVNFNAALRTEGDVRISANAFTVTSPLETRFGKIEIDAGSVNIANSLAVTSAALEDGRDDITLRATSGVLQLQGEINAVNDILLTQTKPGDGALGSIAGESALVVANAISVRADGDVGLRTNTNEMTLRSGGNVRLVEVDDIRIPLLSAAGRVGILAEGVDRGGEGSNPIALKAYLLDVSEVDVSTPNGSMDILTDSPDGLVLGDTTVIRRGDAESMQAAGTVTIRSVAGSVLAYDAPVAAGNARVVDAATIDVLPPHIYDPGRSGLYPGVLSGPGSLLDDAVRNDVFDGVELKVGSRVLVMNQQDNLDTAQLDESRENGIYRVARLGGGVGGFSDWLLVRASDSDSMEGLPLGSYVRVAEGESRGGKLFRISYETSPAGLVERTQNSQLVLSPSFLGASRVRVNQPVTGVGISANARVTDIDAENGVVTLGLGNSVAVEGFVGNTLTLSSRYAGLAQQIAAAIDVLRTVLISGPGIPVGTTVDDIQTITGGGQPPVVTYQLTLSEPVATQVEDFYGLQVANPILDEGIVVGFSQTSSDGRTLNPAARTHLAAAEVVGSTPNSIVLNENFTAWASLYAGQPVYGDGIGPGAVITSFNPISREVTLTPDAVASSQQSLADVATLSRSNIGLWTAVDAAMTYQSGRPAAENFLIDLRLQLLQTQAQQLVIKTQQQLGTFVLVDAADDVTQYVFEIVAVDEAAGRVLVKPAVRPAADSVWTDNNWEEWTPPANENDSWPLALGKVVTIDFESDGPSASDIQSAILSAPGNPDDYDVIQVQVALGDDVDGWYHAEVAGTGLRAGQAGRNPTVLAVLPAASTDPSKAAYYVVVPAGSVLDPVTAAESLVGANLTIGSTTLGETSVLTPVTAVAANRGVFDDQPSDWPDVNDDSQPDFVYDIVRFDPASISSIIGDLRIGSEASGNLLVAEGAEVVGVDHENSLIALSRGAVSSPLLLRNLFLRYGVSTFEIGLVESVSTFAEQASQREGSFGGDRVILDERFNAWYSLEIGQSVRFRQGDQTESEDAVIIGIDSANRLVAVAKTATDYSSPNTDVDPANGLQLTDQSTATVVRASDNAWPTGLDGFDNYIQLAQNFYSYDQLRVGQKVTGSGIAAGAQITAIEPSLRLIGLNNGAIENSSLVESDGVTFEAVSRVNFGMVDGLGTGRASFFAPPFGQGRILVDLPLVAVGAFTAESADTATSTVKFDVQPTFQDWSEVVRNQRVNVVGVGVGTITEIDAGNGVISIELVPKVFARVAVGSAYTLEFVAPADQAAVRSNIGTDYSDGLTTFIVSTGGTDNDAAGSLGKMIQLVQYNDTTRSPNPEQKTDLRFWDEGPGTIFLTQELPAITKPIEIDGKRIQSSQTLPQAFSVAIDGTGIVRDEFGRSVAVGETTFGFNFTAGADGSALRNVQIGNFVDGAAVRVDNVQNVVLDSLRVGLDPSDARATNKNGIVITGPKAKYTTVRDSTIVASLEAGIRVQGGASETRLVGNTVTTQLVSNVVGVQLLSGGNHVGVNSILPLGPASVDATFSAGEAIVRLAGADFSTIYPGLVMMVSSAGGEEAFPATTTQGLSDGNRDIVRIVAVDNVSQTVTVERPPILTGSRSVSIGHALTGRFADNVVTVPETVPLRDLFVGQKVTGDGLPLDVEITSINVGERTIELSESFRTSGFNRTNYRRLAFERPEQNQIEFNRTGIDIGIHSPASGTLGRYALSLAGTFTGWDEIEAALQPASGQVVFVSGPGIATGTRVISANRPVRSIGLDQPLTAAVSGEVSFTIANVDANGQVVGAAISDANRVTNSRIGARYQSGQAVGGNIQDAIVIGAGQNHLIGMPSVEANVLSAEPVPGPTVTDAYELASFRETATVSELNEGNKTFKLTFPNFSVLPGEIAVGRNVYGSSISLPGGMEITAIESEDQTGSDGTTLTGRLDIKTVTVRHVGALPTGFANGSQVTVSFGWGRYVRVPVTGRDGVRIGHSLAGREGAVVPDYTEVIGIRSATAERLGVIELSRPSLNFNPQYANASLRIEPGNTLVFVERGSESNVIAGSGRYGLNVLEATFAALGAAFGGARPVDSWQVRGNYFGTNAGNNPLPNLLGDTSPNFAALLGDSRGFDGVDEEGNQLGVNTPTTQDATPDTPPDIGDTPDDGPDSDPGDTDGGTGGGDLGGRRPVIRL